MVTDPRTTYITLLLNGECLLHKSIAVDIKYIHVLLYYTLNYGKSKKKVKKKFKQVRLKTRNENTEVL